jgi:predicted enzyme related to lactoylglutathione lyase
MTPEEPHDSARPPVALSAIGQIAVNVEDVERAIVFYRDTLGVRFLFQVPKMAFFDCSGVRLMLSLPEGDEFDHPASVLYYKVGDIHATHRELERRGVTFRGVPHLIAKMPDHELWMAFFDDSEGNVMALMSEVR